jgi:hypothetical protein
MTNKAMPTATRDIRFITFSLQITYVIGIRFARPASSALDRVEPRAGIVEWGVLGQEGVGDADDVAAFQIGAPRS